MVNHDLKLMQPKVELPLQLVIMVVEINQTFLMKLATWYSKVLHGLFKKLKDYTDASDEDTTECLGAKELIVHWKAWIIDLPKGTRWM